MPDPDALCAEGPYDVPAGGWVEIPLATRAGDRVAGALGGAGPFRWEIVDWDNLERSLRGRRYVPEARGEGPSPLAWRVPDDGPWSLVLRSGAGPSRVAVTLRGLGPPPGR